jgi:hypothetical protein
VEIEPLLQAPVACKPALKMTSDVIPTRHGGARHPRPSPIGGMIGGFAWMLGGY